MSSFCTNCGAPITPGSAFCTGCGTATQPPVTQPQPGYGYQPLPYPPAPPTSNGANQRILILGLAGAGAIAIITVLLVVLLRGNGPEDAVKNAYKAISAGDCDRMMELSYFDEDSKQTEEEARADCEDSDSTAFDFKVLGTEDHTGPLPSGVSDAAEVKVKLTVEFFGRKISETDTITVYKVDGEWLLYEQDERNGSSH